MRWVSFTDDGGRERVGLLKDGQVRALAAGVRLIDLLGDDGERLHRAGERALADPSDVLSFEGLSLLPPITRPPSVRDFYAFEQHAQMGRRSRGQELPQEWYEIPVFYFTNPTALIGHGAQIESAPGTQRLDFEVEVAAIIGREGRNIRPEDAGRHIIGYTIMNDWSARDLQRTEMKVGLGPAKAKDFATTLGPCLVTVDEIETFRKGAAFDLTMTCSVDGVEYTRGNLADIYWSFEEMAAFASRGATLLPGDVLGSGTCATGCILELSLTHGKDRYPWLQPGNSVEVKVDQLGRIENTVKAGPAPHPLRLGE